MLFLLYSLSLSLALCFYWMHVNERSAFFLWPLIKPTHNSYTAHIVHHIIDMRFLSLVIHHNIANEMSQFFSLQLFALSNRNVNKKFEIQKSSKTDSEWWNRPKRIRFFEAVNSVGTKAENVFFFLHFCSIFTHNEREMGKTENGTKRCAKKWYYLQSSLFANWNRYTNTEYIFVEWSRKCAQIRIDFTKVGPFDTKKFFRLSELNSCT